jgi:hypothetical protein
MKTFKSFKSLAALFLLPLAFTACNRDDEVTNGSDGRVEVKFSASTAEVQTRVTGNNWAADDPVGIYMIDEPGGLAVGNIIEGVDNRQYKASAAGSSVEFAQVDGTSYYPMSGDVEFIAYYPYQSPLTDFELPVDVSDQDDQPAIDVLYAPKTSGGYNKSATSPVALAFQHKLVKLTFTISKGDGVTESLDDLTVKITGQHTAATLDLTGGTVTPSGAVSAITAKTAANGASSEAIVLPNGSVAGMTFTFTTTGPGAGTYEVVVPTPTATSGWEPGYKYAYTVTLNRNEAGISGSVSNWGDGGTYNNVPAIPE